MKISTFKYCIVDAIKDMKRNSTITITSSIAVSISLSIIGIFLLYLMLIDGNSSIFFEVNMKMYKNINRIIKLIEIVVYTVVPLISVILVMNTIKMTIFYKKKEIRTMKLIGATEWFIRWPFIIEGLFIGIIGGIISTFSLYCIYKIIFLEIGKFIPELYLVSPICIIKKMFIPFEIYGVIIGISASIIALRKNFKYI